MATRTNGWRAGDVVSRYFGILGRVVEGRVVARGRVLKVEFQNVKDETVEMWPEGWAIGAGAHEGICGACLNEFRSDSVREVLCPACTRDDAGRTSAGFRVNRDYVGGRRRAS
jgi:hypothetical protein